MLIAILLKNILAPGFLFGQDIIDAKVEMLTMINCIEDGFTEAIILQMKEFLFC